MVAMKSGKENSEVHVGSNSNASSGSSALCSNKENTTTLHSPSTTSSSSSSPPASSLAPSSSPAPPQSHHPADISANSSASHQASQLSTSPTSPVLSLPAKSKDESSAVPAKPSKQPTKCPLDKCLLCTREQPHCLSRSPTWYVHAFCCLLTRIY